MLVFTVIRWEKTQNVDKNSKVLNYVAFYMLSINCFPFPPFLTISNFLKVIGWMTTQAPAARQVPSSAATHNSYLTL